MSVARLLPPVKLSPRTGEPPCGAFFAAGRRLSTFDAGAATKLSYDPRSPEVITVTRYATDGFGESDSPVESRPLDRLQAMAGQDGMVRTFAEATYHSVGADHRGGLRMGLRQTFGQGGDAYGIS